MTIVTQRCRITGQPQDLSILEISVLGIALSCFGCDEAVAQTSPVPAAAWTSEASEIVVTGRHPRTINEKDVRDTIPPQTIKAYAADSIGELLNRLSARFGRNVSVLVNGRRLASIDAITALPPEALEKIELLFSAKGQEFGFSSSESVINLTLRPRFQFAAIEGEAAITTEGAGDTESGTLRYSRIRRENRFNMALTYSRRGGLLESDRQTSTATDHLGRYRSLVPRQETLSLATGYARPLGSLNFDVSSAVSLTSSTTLTGLLDGDGDSLSQGLARASSQLHKASSIRSGATLSGNAGQFFWSLLLSGEKSWISTTNSAGRQFVGAGDRREMAAMLGPDVRSMASSIGATLNMAGPLLTLATGSITVDGTFSARSNGYMTLAVSGGGPGPSNRYVDTRAQGGVSIPITSPGQGLLGFVGDLRIGQRFEYVKTGAIGASFATTSSVDWSPSPALVVSTSRSASPGTASAAILFSPITRRPGVLVYDALSDAVVPVTIIDGGRSDIAQSKSSSTSIQATYQGTLLFANLSTSISYAATKTTNPLVSFSSPSPNAQRLLPALFIRDTNGLLVEFDARPFSGRDDTTRHLSFSLHLNGPVPKKASSPDGANSAMVAPAATSGPAWDLNLNYSHVLRHRLDLGGVGGSIDLLATPLSLSGSGAARHRLNFQWALGKENFGIAGSVTWESGSRLQALDDQTGNEVRFAALAKIGLEAFVELDRSPDATNPRSLRIKVGIENLFNQRQRISGYPGLDAASQAVLNDPYGRIIKLSVRKSL